ncbi:MAG: 4Fe-4S binding protein, partial [Promethearchaeota archaeon]
MSIKVDKELCEGCGACIASCPYDCIEVINNLAVIGDDCKLCGACVEACPMKAIEIVRNTKEEQVDKGEYKGVWIIAEHYKGKIHDVAYQLATKGRELADDLGTELSLILLGDNFEHLLNDFGKYSVDNVIYIKSPILKHYYSDLYVNILTDLIKERKPEIILIGATPTGRDFAPRIAK